MGIKNGPRSEKHESQGWARPAPAGGIVTSAQIAPAIRHCRLGEW